MAIKHYIGIPLQIIGAVTGLFIFVVAESYLKGKTLSELDSKYVVLVAYVGSISVIIISLIYYFVFRGILKSKRISDNVSCFDVVTSGFLLGFIFLPAMYIVLLIEPFIFAFEKLNPYIQITIVLIGMGIISIAITMTIFLILIPKKKTGDNNK
jgi:hypothetical protein